MNAQTTELINPFAGRQPTENPDAGALSVMVREQTEIQSAMIIAKKFPRDEGECYDRAVKSFERPSMAEAAQYCFPRGKNNITGPSIDAARELKRCWRNIRSGVRMVEIRHDYQEGCDYIKIRGFAYDLETNNYEEVEDEFKALIQRKNFKTKKTEWVQPDERDLRELINRRGSICERNALLHILPADLVDEVMRRADETLRAAAEGELAQNAADAVRRLTAAYRRLGVTEEMLERRLKHPLTSLKEEELVELRRIWKAIVDGQMRREEAFEVEAPLEKPTGKDQAPAREYKLGKPNPEPKQPQQTESSANELDPALIEISEFRIESTSSPYFGLTLGQVFSQLGAGVLKQIAASDKHSDTERDFAARGHAALMAAGRV